MNLQPSGAEARADVVALVCDDVRAAVAELLTLACDARDRPAGELVGTIERLAALAEDLAALTGREPAGTGSVATGGHFDLVYGPGEAPAGNERRLRLAAESG